MADEMPAVPTRVAQTHPELWEAYAELGERCSQAGPLPPETRRMVKLALAIGKGSEGAVHSHVRRALAEGVAPDAVRHVALLAIPTLGLPQAMAALAWIEDVVGKGDER